MRSQHFVNTMPSIPVLPPSILFSLHNVLSLPKDPCHTWSRSNGQVLEKKRSWRSPGVHNALQPPVKPSIGALTGPHYKPRGRNHWFPPYRWGRRLREVTWLAQDQTASERHRQSSDLGVYYIEANIHSFYYNHRQHSLPESMSSLLHGNYYLSHLVLTVLRAVVPENRVLVINTGCHLKPDLRGKRTRRVVGDAALPLGHNQLIQEAEPVSLATNKGRNEDKEFWDKLAPHSLPVLRVPPPSYSVKHLLVMSWKHFVFEFLNFI